MRLPVTRLLHVLLSVPVLAVAAIAVTPATHAHAAEVRPKPVVVVIDPGHGGAANPAEPDMPFDPGAIAPSNGLQEKEVTLAVALRLRSLLQADGVDVILTRSDDRSMTIGQRAAVATQNHADLFLSIHFNSFTDSSAVGSLVLYPKSTDAAFARVMDAAMARRLVPLGVPESGIQLRDNWWVNERMPTVTVEPAYLSNPVEAQLIADVTFQQALAQALREGLETFDPAIAQRRAEIARWDRAHPQQVVRPTAAGAASGRPSGSSPLPELLRDGLLVLLLALVVRWPRSAWRVVRALQRTLLRLVERVVLRRAAARRRRRAVLRRHGALQAQRLARPHHIYDDLF